MYTLEKAGGPYGNIARNNSFAKNQTPGEEQKRKELSTEGFIQRKGIVQWTHNDIVAASLKPDDLLGHQSPTYLPTAYLPCRYLALSSGLGTQRRERGSQPWPIDAISDAKPHKANAGPSKGREREKRRGPAILPYHRQAKQASKQAAEPKGGWTVKKKGRTVGRRYGGIEERHCVSE